MSIVSEGLPTHFFSRRNAKLTGIGIAAFVVLCTSTYHWLKPDPKQAPNCYWADEAYVPQNKPIPARGTVDRRGDGIDKRRNTGERLDKMLAAEKACLPKSCDKKAWAEYSSALFWYLEPRLQHTKQLDMNYGDAGLQRAREIYTEPYDRQIEQGLQARYRTGLFKLNDFRQNHDAMTILVLKGGAALRACRKSDAGT